MKFLLIIGSFTVPVLLVFWQKAWPRLGFFLHALALLSALVFGNIASLAIYEILQDQTVFLTNVHSVFLNPFFLLTGEYLGVFLVYKLLLWTFDEP